MAGFIKIKYGLIFFLGSLLAGLPFFHYHPDTTHTHQSELSEHHHTGHFHSNELSGFVNLIHHDTSIPEQDEEHHPHQDTDTGANYFEVNLQKSNGNLVKTFKTFKSAHTQKSIIIAKSTIFHPISFGILAIESSGLADSPKERSPPFSIV